MICTTNLADNLDAAFERRFLFKIQFENPIPACLSGCTRDDCVLPLSKVIVRFFNSITYCSILS